MASLCPNPEGAVSDRTSERDQWKPNSPSLDHISNTNTAGIAIGCVLALIFLLMGSCLVILRKRRGSAHAEPWSKSELSADDVDNKLRGLGYYMVDSTAIAEVEDSWRMPEVDGRSTAQNRGRKHRHL